MSDQQGLPPTCVAYPAGFDFLFVYWYLIRFASESPFSFSCLDIKSYAAATLNVPYRQATKKNMPKSWFKNLPPHTHKGLDDAREQGLLYLNIVKHRESQG
jgi:ATP-dependent Lon protease